MCVVTVYARPRRYYALCVCGVAYEATCCGCSARPSRTLRSICIRPRFMCDLDADRRVAHRQHSRLRTQSGMPESPQAVDLRSPTVRSVESSRAAVITTCPHAPRFRAWLPARTWRAHVRLLLRRRRPTTRSALRLLVVGWSGRKFVVHAVAD